MKKTKREKEFEKMSKEDLQRLFWKPFIDVWDNKYDDRWDDC